MNSVNLIPPRHAAARTARRRRTLWLCASSLTGAVSALVVAVSIANSPVTADGEARLSALVTEQEALDAQSVALMEALESHTRDVAMLERIARQPDWSQLLSDLAEWSADEVMLEQVAVQLESGGAGFQVGVVGLSRSQEFVGGLVKALRESGRFTKVTLGGTQRVDRSEPATFRFDIRCTVAGFGPQAEALR